MSTEIMRMGEFSRSTEVAINTLDGVITMSVNDLFKKYPNAPYIEAMEFLLKCRAIGVNPLIGEAYLVDYKGKWSTIVSKYGYLKCAERHRNQDGQLDFGGFEAGIVIREQITDPRGNPIPGKTKGPPIEVEGSIIPPGFLLLGGWAKVWRKGVDRPFKSMVSLSEYDQDNYIWNSKKCTMIRKVALTHSLREAFAVGDSYDESEVEPIEKLRGIGTVGGVAIGGTNGAGGGAGGAVAITARVVDEESPRRSIEAVYEDYVDPPCSPEVVKTILELKELVGMTDEQLARALSRKGYNAVPEMTANDAKMLASRLTEIASREEFIGKFPGGPSGGGAVAHGGGGVAGEAAVDGPGGAGVAVLEAVDVADDTPARSAVYAEIPTGGPDDE